MSLVKYSKTSMQGSCCNRGFVTGILIGCGVVLVVNEVFVYSNLFEFTRRQRSVAKSYIEALNALRGEATEHPIPNTFNTTDQKSAIQPRVTANPHSSLLKWQKDDKLFSIPEFIAAIQTERKLRLKLACQKYSSMISSNPTQKGSYVVDRSLVSRNYKLVACDIHKCASTSWMQAMWTMENIYTVDDFLHDRVIANRPLAGKKIRLFSVPNNEREEMWNNFDKVLMVRDPFSRLVSAHFDILTPDPPHFFKDLSQNINRKYRNLRHNITERTRRDDGYAKFEDLVNFLVRTDVMNCDPHFRSYLDLCKPCQAQYDYIFKFETMHNEMEFLKQKLNVSDYHRPAMFPRTSFKSDSEKVKKAFQQIPKALTLQLFEKYKQDFEAFGYDKPEWL